MLFIYIHMTNQFKNYNSIAKLSKYSDSFFIAFLTLIDLFMFALVEKFLKEFWVIRETSEKSFKMFMGMVDDNQNEVILVDQSMNLLFINKKFEAEMGRLIQNSFPTQLKEFVHENSLDTFKTQISDVIKNQEPCSTTVYFLKKHRDGTGNIGDKDANVTLLSSGKLPRVNLIYYNKLVEYTAYPWSKSFQYFTNFLTYVSCINLVLYSSINMLNLSSSYQDPNLGHLIYGSTNSTF